MTGFPRLDFPWRSIPHTGDRSIRLVAGGLDQPRPAFALPTDVGGELRSSLARHVEALRLELTRHLRIGVRRLGSGEQPVERGGRRPGAHEQAEPDAGGELRKAKLREGRHVRHVARARIVGHREGAQLTLAQERQRRLHLCKAEQHVPGDEIGGLEARAARWHVHEIEREALVHLEAEEMRRRAGEIGRVAELAGVLLDPGDELRERFGRHGGIGDQHQRRSDAADEWDKVVERPAHIARGVRDDLHHRLGRQQHEIAVGGLIDHVLVAEDARTARRMLDDDRARERARHMLGDEPPVGIGGTAGLQRDDQARRPVGRELRERRLGGDTRSAGRCGCEKCASVHDLPVWEFGSNGATQRKVLRLFWPATSRMRDAGFEARRASPAMRKNGWHWHGGWGHIPRPPCSPPGMIIVTDPLFYLLAVPAVTLLGLGKGGFSGLGMISTPLLALVLPPLQAAAILLPILLVQDMISVWVYRRDYDAWNLRAMLTGAVLGVAAAGLLAAQVSDAHVRIMVGLIGVAFVLCVWFGKVPTWARRPSASAGLFWGALAGFTSTIAQAAALPFQVHMLPQQLDKLTLVGTTLIFFMLVNWMKVVPFVALGQFTAENLATSALLLPFAVATNFLGIWLVRRSPSGLFYRIAYVLMLLISLELIRSGFLGVLNG